VAQIDAMAVSGHNPSVTFSLRPPSSVANLSGSRDMPAFVEGSPLLQGAFQMARSAHHGPSRRGDTDIEHPLAVAQLLSREGFDEKVVAAALLHDTIEDTTLSVGEIADRFGPDVAEIVAEVTENPRIEGYPARKAEARSRVLSDRRAAAIYAADKLANTRELLAGQEDISGERLDHYIKTLRFLSAGRPDLPFLAELSEELAKLVDREAR
jgi:GTP diphosphokinase / guanosine-3',5'-bis(diphosphate) 3'-diphosphatase